MSYLNDPMRAALDRHITGNYGEDQFRQEEEWEAFLDHICGGCDRYETCEHPENGTEEECEKVKGEIERRNKQVEEDNDALYELYKETQCDDR